jgi:hypothetical protein
VTASRHLVDRLCSEHRIPLLVLHDFDKAGFSIVGTLRRPTRRYTFRHAIEVIDLGLRLEDVNAHDLEPESCHYKFDPADNLAENGATEEEIAFLRGERWGRSHYVGRRVELNAFTSGSFLAWIEAKLREHGIGKVVPPADALALAYRRAVEIELVKKQLEAIRAPLHDEAQRVPVPQDLAETVRRQQESRPELPWDAIIGELAARQLVKTGGE